MPLNPTHWTLKVGHLKSTLLVFWQRKTALSPKAGSILLTATGKAQSSPTKHIILPFHIWIEMYSCLVSLRSFSPLLSDLKENCSRHKQEEGLIRSNTIFVTRGNRIYVVIIVGGKAHVAPLNEVGTSIVILCLA